MSDSISSLVPQDLPITQTKKHVVVDSVVKPLDLMASPKSSSSSSLVALCPPDSLRRLMTSGSQKSGRTPFTVDFDRLKKNVEAKTLSDEALDLYGYGYGYGADEGLKSCSSATATQSDEGAKRRKFQRRNSKTPAMLMAMNSPLLFHLDFLEDKKEHEQSAAPSATATSELPKAFEFTASKAFDSWDTGIEIAEDLVMHLQKRKRASQP
jgi:hypothetical protein